MAVFKFKKRLLVLTHGRKSETLYLLRRQKPTRRSAARFGATPRPPDLPRGLCRTHLFLRLFFCHLKGLNWSLVKLGANLLVSNECHFFWHVRNSSIFEQNRFQITSNKKATQCFVHRPLSSLPIFSSKICFKNTSKMIFFWPLKTPEITSYYFFFFRIILRCLI